MKDDLNNKLKKLSEDATMTPSHGAWERVQLKLRLRKEQKKSEIRKIVFGIMSFAAMGLILVLINISNSLNPKIDNSRVKYHSYQLVDFNEKNIEGYYAKSVHPLNKAYKTGSIKDFDLKTIKASTN